jgi:phosphoribosylanthranilate isomerase
MSFLVKICGLTRPADAELACRAGAGAIGLNFWSGSKRFVEDGLAREILAAVTPGVLKVGVFVNASRREVGERVARLGLDLAQLHGDEAPAAWTGSDGTRLIRALRVADQGSLAQAEGWTPRYFLYDAFAEGYGGAGQLAPWEIVARGGRRPFLLAGGLHPDNVAAAIAMVRPDGVDVASGVETSPGIKEAAKLAAFIANARRAAARVTPRLTV